jgi:hypothetical protein
MYRKKESYSIVNNVIFAVWLTDHFIISIKVNENTGNNNYKRRLENE